MTKNNKPEPVSVAEYQVLVADCAAMLTVPDCDKEKVYDRLLELARRPIKSPRIKVIFEDGITAGCLSDGPADIEIVNIDTDADDYEGLDAYRESLYADESLKETEYTIASAEDDD